MMFMRYLKHQTQKVSKLKDEKYLGESIVKNKASLAMLIADKIEFQENLIKDKEKYYNDRRECLQDLHSNAKFFWHLTA